MYETNLKKMKNECFSTFFLYLNIILNDKKTDDFIKKYDVDSKYKNEIKKLFELHVIKTNM